MTTFEWELSGSEVPEIGHSVVHSTPARAPTRQKKRTHSASIDDLPVLFKKNKLDMSADLKIIEEVKEAYLGSARIQTAHLTLGIQLREIREAFATDLMNKMIEFPGHFCQPLCVIIDTLGDIIHFKETNEETKGVIKLLIQLATLEEETYHLLQEVLCQHGNGRLKGQNLSYKDITNGPDMKPYVLVSLPSTAAKQVLSQVRDGTMTLPYLQETKLLVKLQAVQWLFLHLMCIKSWEDAMQQYPRAATREVLEHFRRFNLRSTPPELKSFCQQLKLEASMELQCFKGITAV
ncbi:hypothetical protein BSL78_26837 [Apostichopus japonicus]|uniref:Uncharacterized protein n=1 Tax=Stichopus japonicus TaxID=307972 RepID=A0A2G8JKS8_STIJA|nr:hypothetical protein BSL78_26837 [Apostichopus japonicus]